MNIGQITLNISFGLYLIFLCPQILYNALNKSVKELSLMMHFILFLAYLADLGYGFGRQLPWQYKMVTISGLICLSIQNIQFFLYGRERKFYKVMNIILLIFAGIVIYSLFTPKLPFVFFIILGIISQIGWLLYAIPQIYHNAKVSSIDGLNFYFVLLAFIITICDTISAWSLNWDLPNKIGSPISLILKIILLWQFTLYSNKKSKL